MSLLEANATLWFEDWACLMRDFASTAKPEPAGERGSPQEVVSAPTLPIADTAEALNTPTDFAYEVSTSGGPRESRTVVYPL
jgi:hypothetical protein